MVRNARRLAEQLLGDDPRTEDAVLIVSEYFSNSVLHSASGEEPVSEIRVTLEATPEMLRIEVEDAGKRRTPADTRCSEPGDFGRGQAVVDGIATKWGHDSNTRRGLAWAELR
jgi:anti-sigma regulatory factor (Ser/Thr protein kinase)